MHKAHIGGLPSQLISRRTRSALLAAFVALSTGSGLWAATVTWDAGAGADAAWTTGLNWDGTNVVPATGDTAIIDGAYNISLTGAQTANYTLLQINNGATLTVDSSAQLNAASSTQLGTSAAAGTVVMNGGAWSAGVLTMGSATAPSGTNTFTLNNGALTTANMFIGNAVTGIGVVNIYGGSLTSSGTQVSIGEAGAGTLNINGSSALVTIKNGAFYIGSGTTGSSGTLILVAGTLNAGASGTNTIAVGAGTTSTGTLSIGNGGAYTATLNAGTIIGGSTSGSRLNFNHSNTVTFGNVISGTMIVQKFGAGITQLTGVNTYTGGTIIAASGGTLLANSTNSTGSGAVTVNSLAKLGGSGTIQGNVVSNGIITPGALSSLGNLTVTGAGGVTWNGGANSTNAWQFDLGASNTSDKLIITNALTKGTGSVFAFDFLGGGTLGSTYQLATFGSSTFASSDFTAVNLAAGLSASFTKAANSVSVTLTASAVPEPSTIATIAGAVILGYVVIRRRKTAAVLI